MSRGFDNVRYNQELLLCLPMEAGVGAIAYDFAKPHHPVTLNGVPIWTNLANDLTVLNFDPNNPDYLYIAAADSVDLNFTSGAFAGACWIRGDALGNRNIFTKSVHNTDGWYWYIFSSGAMWFVTSQAAAYQYSAGAANDIQIDVWRFVAFSRTGAAVTMVTNGVDVTATSGTHIDPATAVARSFYAGVNNAAGAAWYDGDLWGARIWGKAVTVAEFKSMFERERTLFNV